MKIRHYLYNTFLVEEGDAKVAIDPGQHLWMFDLHSLIPESEWPTVTHVVITHGDPDHHWQSDRVAEASGAQVICGKGLTRQIGGQTLVVDPRGRGLTSWVPFKNLHALDVGDTIAVGDVDIQALKSVHGPIAVSVLGFTVRKQPGPNERIGIGSMGFKITVGGKSIVNLGDSLLLPEWEGLSSDSPDVLMLPIGGLGQNTWTMDVEDAVKAVQIIRPQTVIPCHYNVPFLWKRRIANANDIGFKHAVEALGVNCHILHSGESLVT